MNHHCHCGYCRKHHGSAFATFVGVAEERLTWTRGDVIAHRSSPRMVRESCATCGTPLPQRIAGFPVFVPAGCLGEFPERPEAHIFGGSKLPWTEIRDGLPVFEAFPPGVIAEAEPSRAALDPPGGVRGSCLCGDVRYRIEGPGIAARHCHCSRCRKARGAAHASNLVVPLGGLRFTSGESSVRRYKVPEARFFTQSFCSRCGAKVPTLDASRKIAVVPLGGLDDPPPLAPQAHIWTAEMPRWSGIYDALPQYPGPPPT
jgi:hypothetical protein